MKASNQSHTIVMKGEKGPSEVEGSIYQQRRLVDEVDIHFAIVVNGQPHWVFFQDKTPNQAVVLSRSGDEVTEGGTGHVAIHTTQFRLLDYTPGTPFAMVIINRGWDHTYTLKVDGERHELGWDERLVIHCQGVTDRTPILVGLYSGPNPLVEMAIV